MQISGITDQYLTRQCDIFLLGDLLSSIEEYMGEEDCYDKKEIDDLSQVLLQESHSTTSRNNYGGNNSQIFDNQLGANIPSTTRLESGKEEDAITFENKLKNPTRAKEEKDIKWILNLISLALDIETGEVSTNGTMSGGSEDGFVPGNDQRVGNSFSDKISEHKVQDQDEEEGRAQSQFRNILVAVSGSPMFEIKIFSNLKKLGLPSKQVATFCPLFSGRIPFEDPYSRDILRATSLIELTSRLLSKVLTL
jgi:hypothetical protein